MENGPPQHLDVVRESLRLSEERFRLLVDSVKEYAIFMLDPHGVVASWNAGAERIKGYAPNEIIGHHFSRFYRPEDRWKCAMELEVATRDGRVEDEGYRVRKDGTLFWANVVITCLRDPGTKEIVGFAKVTRDLTERRRAEETLRESEERIRLLVESVRDYAIFMLDPNGIVVSWNVGAERIKGYRADEIIGQHFSKFVPRAEAEAGKCEYELEAAARDGRFEDEGFRVRKDGSLFWANVVITALREGSGKLIGFAKVTRDLTERRRAEEERLRLGELAKERVRILADLSEALASAASVAEVGRFVSEQAVAFAGARSCIVYLADESQAKLELVAHHGISGEEAVRLPAPSGAEDPLYRIGTGRTGTSWLEHAAACDSYLRAALGTPESARSFWCLPLVVEDKSIGVMAVGFGEARQFEPDEREFVLAFARQCGQALARARGLELERAAAAAVDRLRAWLSTTLRSIGDAVIATDQHGAVTFMNGVAESLTRWTESDARHRPLSEIFNIVNEHTRAPVQSPVEKVLETGGIVGLANHTVLIARDGSELPIDDSGAPIRGEQGQIEGVVLVFRDVTQRKREEAQRAFLSDATSALAESFEYEQTLRRVAELAVPRVADVCAVDLVVAGQSLPKRAAFAPVESGDLPPEQHEASLESPLVPHVIEALRTGKPVLVTELADGDSSPRADESGSSAGSALIVPIVTQGRSVGTIGFASRKPRRVYDERDLEFAEELARRCGIAIENSRLYRASQEARRSAEVANRSKDEFLAVVSHELRTPLNAIMGWAKLLGSGPLDDQRKRSAVETIERNSVAMAQLIEDLLDMSRVISGKMRLEVQGVELSRVIEAAIDAVRPAAAARGVELVPELASGVPPIMGDPTRLQQIAWNLLSNAVKFTPRDGRVTVSLRRTGSSIELAVSDTGKGIAREFLPHVFEAFRQEDASPSRSRGGLGLGLAISRQLVELHGGRIRAESEGEGRGATFVVSLPISAVAARERESERGARQIRVEGGFERPPHLRGLRILVVDDDDDARHLVRMILEDCGCVVTTASGVEDAMTQLHANVPDLLLSDIGMPGTDGYELIRRVRALPHDQGGDIPAAALTAFARPEDRRRMLNAGFSIHLPKPIEPAELVTVVSTLSRFMHRSDRP